MIKSAFMALYSLTYSIGGKFQSLATWAWDLPIWGEDFYYALAAIGNWFGNLASEFAEAGTLLQDLADRIPTDILSPSAIFAWIMDWLGISKYSGETWWQAITRKIADTLPDIEVPSLGDIFAWIMNHLDIYKSSRETWWQAITRKIADTLPDIDVPSFEEIFAWIMSHHLIYKSSRETWWQAITRKIIDSLPDIHIPTWNEIWIKVLESLGIYKESGESTWDAIMRTIITSIPGLAGIINFWNTWWEALNDFFSSPLDWLETKFADWFLGPEK